MNYRSPFFNLILGSVFGATLASAVTVHLATARAQQRIVPLEALNRKNAEDAKRLADQVEQVNAGWLKQYKEQAAALHSCTGTADAQDFRDRFFTLVYEPQPEFAPSAQGQAVAAILNLYRPGLGTVLARLQTPPQPGMQLRMVLRGYVRAEQLPLGVHLVYTLSPDAAAANGQVQ